MRERLLASDRARLFFAATDAYDRARPKALTATAFLPPDPSFMRDALYISMACQVLCVFWNGFWYLFALVCSLGPYYFMIDIMARAPGTGRYTCMSLECYTTCKVETGVLSLPHCTGRSRRLERTSCGRV